MASRKKKRDRHPANMESEMLAPEHSHSPPLEYDPAPPAENAPTSQPTLTRLHSLREEAIQGRKNTAQMVAELEEWRAEIDATIALLRAR